MKSVINATLKPIKSKTLRINSITINNNYSDIDNYIPSGMPNFLFASINNVAGGFVAVVSANGKYVFIDAPNGTVVPYIEVKYIYGLIINRNML